MSLTPFITIEKASQLEGIGYKTFNQRILRNPDKYVIKREARDEGGKALVMISVSSLSPKAQRAYEKEQPREDAEAIVAARASGERPWYVDADFNWFYTNYQKEFTEGLDLLDQIKPVMMLSRKEHVAEYNRLAEDMGISLRTLYRYIEALREAAAWALKLELEDGYFRTIAFQAMALCRKPRKGNTFPSLTEAHKELITRIWFNPAFASNEPSMELAYIRFKEYAERTGWVDLPSSKTVARYIKFLMSDPRTEHAHYLAAHGEREYKRNMLQKAKRDASTLDILEFVQGDEHTFDFWVAITSPNGKIRAIRPKLVAWVDTRSRMILGDLICETPNANILKQSLIKLVYSEDGGVPKHLHIDNGADYVAKTNTGQHHNDRQMAPADFDAEVQGFYRMLGIEKWTRALPYQPWSKGNIERFFGTVCGRFSKAFASYVGTLTGSKTIAKREKDIKGMLERGELITIEELYAIWSKWLHEAYHQGQHRSLKDAKEAYTTPYSLYTHANRYKCPAPPLEHAATLLMQTDTAHVTSQGITRFSTLYTGTELCYYAGKTVNIRWDSSDVSTLHVFSLAGEKICEAISHELLQYGDRVSQKALETHIRKQKEQMRDTRAKLRSLNLTHGQLVEYEEGPEFVGGLDLTIKAAASNQVIKFPNDKEYQSEKAQKSRKKETGLNDYYQRQAAEVYEALKLVQQ